MATPPRKPRLKVFTATFGFHEIIVAAPSQAAALKAWDVSQNLFAEGLAKVSTDAAAVKAALAHPGVLLRRPIGSSDAFTLTPAAPSARSTRRGMAAKPNRKALDAAEAALKSLETEHRREAAELRARRRALETEEAAAERRWVRAKAEAERAVKRAAGAFAKAGGKP